MGPGDVCILCFVILCALVLHSLASDCSDGVCYSQFDYTLESSVVPQLDAISMHNHCIKYRRFASCMVNAKKDCDVATQQMYTGIDDAYHFLCDESFNDYLQYQPCFAKDAVQQDTKQCNYTLTSRLSNLNYIVPDLEYRRTRFCNYAGDYLECVGDVLTPVCGSDAAAWQRTFDSKTLAPLMSYYRCPGWDSSTLNKDSSGTYTIPLWVWVVIVTTVAGIALILVLSALYLVCTRFAKPPPRHRHHLRRSTSVDMPPPYTGPYLEYYGPHDEYFPPPLASQGATSTAVESANKSIENVSPEQSFILPPHASCRQGDPVTSPPPERSSMAVDAASSAESAAHRQGCPWIGTCDEYFPDMNDTGLNTPSFTLPASVYRHGLQTTSLPTTQSSLPSEINVQSYMLPIHTAHRQSYPMAAPSPEYTSKDSGEFAKNGAVLPTLHEVDELEDSYGDDSGMDSIGSLEGAVGGTARLLPNGRSSTARSTGVTNPAMDGSMRFPDACGYPASTTMRSGGSFGGFPLARSLSAGSLPTGNQMRFSSGNASPTGTSVRSAVGFGIPPVHVTTQISKQASAADRSTKDLEDSHPEWREYFVS